VLLLRPGRENSKNDHNGNLKHLVYQLERAVRCMDEESGVGKMTVILDLHNYSTSNAPPMRTSRATLDILQNHYPERLSKFVIVHAPWLFYAFFKVISPFIDKVTASKVVFIKDNAKKTMEANVNLTRIPPSILCPTKPTAATDDAFFFEPHIYFSYPTPTSPLPATLHSHSPLTPIHTVRGLASKCVCECDTCLIV